VTVHPIFEPRPDDESIRLDPRCYDDGTKYEGAEVAELFAQENVEVMQAIRSMSPEKKKEREKLQARRKEKQLSFVT
jgi:hypothetical protein